MHGASKGEPVTDRALRIAVHAGYPALRAGLAALLHDAGFEIVDGEGDRLPDVVVADLAGEVAAASRPDNVPTVYLADARLVPLDAAPQAWLPRDASAEALEAAVHAVAAGMIVLHPALASMPEEADHAAGAVGIGLTSREIEVLPLLAAGLTNKAIAHTLSISEHTAKFHVGAILAKLGVSSRAEAVAEAARRGLLVL